VSVVDENVIGFAVYSVQAGRFNFETGAYEDAPFSRAPHVEENITKPDAATRIGVIPAAVSTGPPFTVIWYAAVGQQLVPVNTYDYGVAGVPWKAPSEVRLVLG
jgi:hypothetical protein